MKRNWREFKHGQPGRRFQDRYERKRKTRSTRSPWIRFLKPVAAVLLLAAGLFFCLIPGPGVPLLIFGAALLADVSRRVAVALDWLDPRLRAQFKRCRLWWSGASLAAKGTVMVLTLLFLSGAVYGLVRIVK